MGPDWFDYRAARGRILVYISDLGIVLAGVVFAIAVGRHWSWGPFALGVIVGVFAVFAYAALLGIVVKVVRPDGEQLSKARDGLRQRNLIVIPGYLSIGLCTGLIAGSVPSYWPDVVLALMILVLGVLVPLAFLPLAKRKADAQRNRSESTT